MLLSFLQGCKILHPIYLYYQLTFFRRIELAQYTGTFGHRGQVEEAEVCRARLPEFGV